MMILEIQLENFFSIKDAVILDFRAAKIRTAGAQALPANVIACNGKTILKSIGLFGANASGKSNIFKAINFCRRTILNSHQYNEGMVFGFSPFKFEGCPGKPGRFSIDFIHDSIEYEYSFTLTTDEILKESLCYYPNGRQAKVFDRDEQRGTGKAEIYRFSNGIIPRPLDVATNTSRKTLFLSRASQMDRELCKKIYRFFLQDFFVGFAPLNFAALGAANAKLLFSRNKDLILHALSICDSDIADINMIQEKQMLPTSLNPQFPDFPQSEETIVRFETFHKTAPSIAFDLFMEESAGTTQLFSMLFFLLDVIKNEKAFMLDEFDLSLHTKLAEFVIDLFHAGSQAQFLFASHNTNLIDMKRFRRDQIVFVNKKGDGSTELYSLYDHKDFRENMDAEKGYLQGRFDALPLVDNSFAALKKLLGDWHEKKTCPETFPKDESCFSCFL
ncbi:MAG: ATP-binding protein [Treponema sp.]|jgi:AAA15 family ATPase/GTPase|nr:ATP-binding protein [Treponema sp.]